MTKKTVKSVILLLVLLTVALYFVSGTYARYTDALTGTATAEIAKWAVQVDGTDVSESQTLTLEFTTDSNDFVTSGKIAPASSISANLALDLTGTEVAVDILGKVDTTSLTDTIGTSKFTTTITVDGKELKEAAETDPTIALAEVSKSHDVKITITWDNDEDKHNADDTNLGRKTTQLELPVTLTVQQHIAAQ